MVSSRKDVQHRNKELIVCVGLWSCGHREENQLRECSYFKVPRYHLSSSISNFQVMQEQWKQ